MLSTARTCVRIMVQHGGSPRRDAGDATRAAVQANRVPHSCRTKAKPGRTHGHLRAAGTVDDLQTRQSREEMECPPKQQVRHVLRSTVGLGGVARSSCRYTHDPATHDYGTVGHSRCDPEEQQEEKHDEIERDRRVVSAPVHGHPWLPMVRRWFGSSSIARVKSVLLWKEILLNLAGSARMKELRAPVPDIEQPEEHRAHHGHEQKVAMMLRQGETDDG
jgi:hypothetical protein